MTMPHMGKYFFNAAGVKNRYWIMTSYNKKTYPGSSAEKSAILSGYVLFFYSAFPANRRTGRMTYAH